MDQKIKFKKYTSMISHRIGHIIRRLCNWKLPPFPTPTMNLRVFPNVFPRRSSRRIYATINKCTLQFTTCEFSHSSLLLPSFGTASLSPTSNTLRLFFPTPVREIKPPFSHPDSAMTLKRMHILAVWKF